MFVQKSNLFLDLTKNQKASLVSYLKNFVKKHQDKNESDILDCFLEDEQYYYDVGNPHFEWIIELFEDDGFIKEVIFLIKQYKNQMKVKEQQKPFLEKQKLYMKEQRKKAQEFKLSNEPPTEKQLKYYKSLCSKYKLSQSSFEGLSKLDLKNMIGQIIEEHEKEVFKCLEKNL